MYGRLKMFTQQMSEMTKSNPGAHHDVKERHLHDMKGLNERNFSFGERKDLSAPANNYPGAQYLIGGFCDRFQKIKHKNGLVE